MYGKCPTCFCFIESPFECWWSEEANNSCDSLRDLIQADTWRPYKERQGTSEPQETSSLRQDKSDKKYPTKGFWINPGAELLISGFSHFPRRASNDTISHKKRYIQVLSVTSGHDHMSEYKSTKKVTYKISRISSFTYFTTNR